MAAQQTLTDDFRPAPTIRSPVWMRLRRLRRHHGLVLGGAMLIFIVALAIGAHLIAPFDPLEVDPSAILSPPGSGHLLGTDALGRDLFSRVIFGGRISLLLGLISVGISLLFGVLLGVLAGYFGG